MICQTCKGNKEIFLDAENFIFQICPTCQGLGTVEDDTKDGLD